MPWGAVVAAGVGLVGSSMAADSAASAQQQASASAASSAAAQLAAQVKQADDLLDFNKTQYADYKARQDKTDALNEQVINQQMDLSQKAGDRADNTYQNYLTNGQPLINQTLNESKNYDSQGNIDDARARASADVQQSFSNAQQQSQRALTRMGVNPSSGRFLALQQSMQAQQAASMAGAQTNAEENRRSTGIQMRQQASNLANGLPAQSLAQGAQSSGTATAAASTGNLGLQQTLAGAQTAMNATAAAGGIYGSAANGYNNSAQIANNAYNSINSAAAQSASGWGNLAGTAFSAYKNLSTPTAGSFNTSNIGYGNGTGTDSVYGSGATYSGGDGLTGFGYAEPTSYVPMANGGKVKGPGTGTSDSVPAVNTSTGGRVQLSNGEYVLSADTVRAIGTDKLDKLQQKYHTPVNLGRKAA